MWSLKTTAAAATNAYHAEGAKQRKADSRLSPSGISRHNKYMTCWWNTEHPKMFESISEHVPENFSQRYKTIEKILKNRKNVKIRKTAKRHPAVTKKNVPKGILPL